MLTNEAELRALLARHQPELAERLAHRLAQLPQAHVDALLVEGAQDELTPKLREVIDYALTEELGDGGLLEQADRPQLQQPRVTEGRLSAKRVTTKPPEAKLQKGHLQEGQLLIKVASLQPEMAKDIVRLIELEGPELVRRCLTNDVALQQQVDQALKQLWEADQETEEASASCLFSRGKGHVLPGEKPATASVTAKARSIRSSVGSGEVATSGHITSMSSRQAVELTSGSRQTASVDVPRRDAGSEGHPKTSTTGLRGGKGRIWGLEEFLSELGLSEYEEAVTKWASEMGAIFLEELVENAQDLGEAMALKPLERKRLERHGPQAMRQIVSQRPKGTEKKRTQEVKAPSPDELPKSRLFR